MPIKVTVALTRDFENLAIYDHIGGNEELDRNPDKVCGPFLVATDGSTSRVGRLLFRFGDPDDPTERIYDVRAGWNPLPPHTDFGEFAKFVMEFAQAEQK